jgi:hypothetical protein
MSSEAPGSEAQQFSSKLKSLNIDPQPNDKVTLAGATATKPMLFEFTWRSRRFRGSIAPQARGCRVALTTFLGDPDAGAGASGSLVAVIDLDSRRSQGRIKLVSSHDVLIDESLELPGSRLAVDGLVSSLAIVVLAAAPYLDLLTGGAPIRAGENPAAAA